MDKYYKNIKGKSCKDCRFWQEDTWWVACGDKDGYCLDLDIAMYSDDCTCKRFEERDGA